MEIHRGRLIDHLHLRVAELERSRAFYRAVLQPLGRDLIWDTEHFFTADELFVSGAKGGPVSRVHLALQADSPQMVQAFHAAALAAGGIDNGAPGARSYHPGYYGAFVLDPDGNNLKRFAKNLDHSFWRNAVQDRSAARASPLSDVSG